MGSCMTRMKAEMVPPPPRAGNWQSCAPQRPETCIPGEMQQVMYRKTTAQSSGNGSPLDRKETESGIPGLTYDQAGRPVWREENAVRVEHKENMW
ncbi:hypothetical protein ONS95_000274 [Cadophora gregata]|uniref:uncharacterized protein n=1 Tax=Cadophora gregata TaxID=51156 RepID=UPI0026DBE38D|nr:uncharacterized protein ONS95_000274 [Cadophora gregata]KAK0125726.1 hypothetical protein ONS96_009557 [Cadophora gregata f. sp. sojae]KAK0128299.1 hypothetical protein ONS95_000274 [Cadophora gregata]